MATDSPFFLTKVECPICRTVNEIETVRVGAYVEEGRDTDFRPTKINWRRPEYRSYNPLAFFAATCRNCHYTREFTNAFKDWKSDGNFITYRLKAIKDKHLDQMATADSFVKRMGEAVDVERLPDESAVLKLHLAIFDELLAEHYSSLDVGRFYLRVGWVYRGMDTGKAGPGQEVQALAADISGRYATLKTLASDLEKEAGVFARHVSSHFESSVIPSQVRDQLGQNREGFETAIDKLRQANLTVAEAIKELGAATGAHKTLLLGEEGLAAGDGIGGCSDFGEFLRELKGQWNQIALDEREALELAVHYYKEAFVDGRTIAPGNQQIQAAYLIAELSRRVGDYQGAKEYFNTTIKLGQDFIFKNRGDQSRTALARKILELAIEQGRSNMSAIKTA